MAQGQTFTPRKISRSSVRPVQRRRARCGYRHRGPSRPLRGRAVEAHRRDALAVDVGEDQFPLHFRAVKQLMPKPMTTIESGRDQ
jgi:hypothetical protein